MKQSRVLSSGAVSTAVSDAIRNDYAVEARPRLIVDWNLNRYTMPEADNKPSDQDEGFDIESFPIESIADPNRPTKGIIKARIGESVVGTTYQRPLDPKFYIGDPEDVYKYWTSPYRTNGSGVFPLHTDGESTVRPFINYKKLIQVNKIVVKVENTWASPTTHQVRIQTAVDGTWSGAGPANPPIANDGTITLWYNGTAWVTTRPANPVRTSIAGIMYRVEALGGGIKRDGTPMTYTKARYDLTGTQYGRLDQYNTDGSFSSLNLIAIEAHVEEDLTNRLISTSDDYQMGEASQLYPIGTITSNQGSITLANEDAAFNRDNASSPYYELIEPSAEVNLEYIYDINGTEHVVQGFKMQVADWVSDESTTTCQLEDASAWLKLVKPRSALYENRPVTEVIWRVLDSVGFVDYDIQEEDIVIEHQIPYFWVDGEKTVWEILDELAQATQTAIYFDEWNRLQVRTREAAFRIDEPNWRLYGQTTNGIPADIISLENTGEFEANKIDVTYKATKWDVSLKGKPALTKVWEPDGDSLVVRAAPLKVTLNPGDAVMHLSQDEVKTWPYKSKVNIDNEIIEYEGKRYLYYEGGTAKYATIKDHDEIANYDKKTAPANRYKNHFTGGLVITERGVWNTEEVTHSVDANNWNAKGIIRSNNANSVRTDIGGFKLNREDSTVTINTPAAIADANDTLFVTRGSSASTGYKAYGTKLRFNDDGSQTTQRAGLGFNLNGTQENGYYVELTLSSKLGATERATRNEVTIFSRVGGDWKPLSNGQPIAVGKALFYEVDVFVSSANNVDTITVWVNGQKVATAEAGGANRNASGGRVAMYARGKTNVSYEFFYAVTGDLKTPPDSFGFYDLKYGGFRGGQWEREYVWETKSRWKKIGKKKWRKIGDRRENKYLFDEFGPYVHEVREFDVKFEGGPCQYSYLFSTNEWYSATLEYAATPFGAKFIVANVGRENAVLKGEDQLLFGGAGSAVNQVFTVLGRTLDVQDDETVHKENKQSIRKRGPIESELTSDWIQSRGMAEDVARWMDEHWSEGVDEAQVEIFGNPLIQIGDIVDIDYDDKNMEPAQHRYFVVATANAFDTGITTQLTLRRMITT